MFLLNIIGQKMIDPIGLITIDALYSPIKKVSYKVESAREGQILDYDKLNMIIDTDGSIGGEDAVAFASRILQDRSIKCIYKF